MPYIKRIVKAGDTIEVKKYFSARYGKKDSGGRARKENETSEKQKKVNENNAAERLTWLINENFRDGDYHIVLTYSDENRPSADESAELLKKYLRKLRSEYRKEGSELKYITVTEYETTNIHHHIIINKFDTSVISDLWMHGGVHFTPLYSNGEYSKLAHYFVKETNKTFKDAVVSGKRWNASRNLRKPHIVKTVVQADSWTKNPKPLKGYYIATDSVAEDVDSFGYAFQKYTMIKIKPVKKGRYQSNAKCRSNNRKAHGGSGA